MTTIKEQINEKRNQINSISQEILTLQAQCQHNFVKYNGNTLAGLYYWLGEVCSECGFHRPDTSAACLHSTTIVTDPNVQCWNGEWRTFGWDGEDLAIDFS